MAVRGVLPLGGEERGGRGAGWRRRRRWSREQEGRGNRREGGREGEGPAPSHAGGTARRKGLAPCLSSSTPSPFLFPSFFSKGQKEGPAEGEGEEGGERRLGEPPAPARRTGGPIRAGRLGRACPARRGPAAMDGRAANDRSGRRRAGGGGPGGRRGVGLRVGLERRATQAATPGWTLAAGPPPSPPTPPSRTKLTPRPPRESPTMLCSDRVIAPMLCSEHAMLGQGPGGQGPGGPSYDGRPSYARTGSLHTIDDASADPPPHTHDWVGGPAPSWRGQN